MESSNQVPDGDTIGRFRNILERNGLDQEIFAQVVILLQKKGLLLKKGTIVDFHRSPFLNQNEEKRRDLDAHQAKKGNTWHFGYKAHIGVDKDSGIVHTVDVTAANVSDVSETAKLLTGEEETVNSATVAILERQSAWMPLYATKKVRKSNTKSIGAPLR
mgnify:FL=1